MMKEIKRLLCLSVVICLLCTLTPVLPAAAAGASPYSDVNTSAPSASSAQFADMPAEDNWAYDGINFVISTGLMRGTSEAAFSPDQKLTRAMVVTVLHRLAGQPDAAAASCFQDVPAKTWYTDAVAWASERGIVQGVSKTKFAPNELISREQLATLFYRYAEQNPHCSIADLPLSVEKSIAAFRDGETVSKWAKAGVEWTLCIGVMKGTKDNALQPERPASRAEFAVMLQRFHELLENPDYKDGGVLNCRTEDTVVSHTLLAQDVQKLRALFQNARWDFAHDIYAEWIPTYEIQIGHTVYSIYVNQNKPELHYNYINYDADGKVLSQGGYHTADASVLDEILAICRSY